MSSFLDDLSARVAPLSLQLSSGYGVASLAWFAAHQPKLIEEATHCGTIMDFVAARLAVSARHCMSATNAASFGAFDAAAFAWQLPVLQVRVYYC